MYFLSILTRIHTFALVYSQTATCLMLFEDFAFITPKEWKELILKTIKTETEAEKQQFYEKKLIQKPEPGLEITPFYTPDSLCELEYLKGFHRLWTQTRQTTGWMNVQAIVVENEQTANFQAKNVLAKGADAILFTNSIQGYSCTHLLDGLSPVQMPLYFKAASYETLLPFLKQTYDTTSLMGGVVDPTDAQTAAFCQQTPYFRMLFQTDSQPESLVTELVTLLQKAMTFVDRMQEAGHKPHTLLPHISFMATTDNRYFLQIAKLRALRLLWWQIGRLYDPTLNLVDVFVFVTVQAVPAAADEPYKSLISNTTQAMSAIIGGCDALSVVSTLPADTDLGNRIARNVSVILKEESYLDTVTDLGAGSYLIENLTHQLAKAAWERISS